MLEFWHAIFTDAWAFNALLAGLLASVACGVIGSFVVARRITYVAAGIAHCVLGGLGLARYLNIVHGWTWLEPVHGALLAALLAAAVIGWVSLRAREREDTVISAVWAIGMASGLLFINATPGYQTDLMRYLFGTILLVSKSDLWAMLALDAAVIALVWLFYHPFQALCFDESFARVRNLRVERYYLLLLALTAVTVVLLSMVVGLVLVIALFTLPVAIAGRFSASLPAMMVGAVLLCALFTAAGLALSYGPDLPAGPTIILLTGAGFLAVAAGSKVLKRRRAPPA